MGIILQWGGFSFEPTTQTSYEQSLFFVCPQSVEQGKNGAKIGHMVTYFFATRSANKEKRDCPQSINKKYPISSLLPVVQVLC